MATDIEHMAGHGMDVLVQDVQKIIETARSNAVRSVDFCRVNVLELRQTYIRGRATGERTC